MITNIYNNFVILINLNIMSKKIILTINPGSTSTKIALYSSNDIIFLKNIPHSFDDLNNYARISDQFKFRKDIILKLHEKRMIIIQKNDYVLF